MLFLITLSLSCATLADRLWPQLKDRTLRISRDGPVLFYQDYVCVKKIAGICFRRELKKETYDLNDKNIRDMLINMGFVVRVREDIE